MRLKKIAKRVLTGLILEVRILPVGEEPGLQTEIKGDRVIFWLYTALPLEIPADAARAIIALRHVRTWLFTADHPGKQHAPRIDRKFQSFSYPVEAGRSIRVSYTQ